MSSVKVALRIRPRNTKEILDNNSECIIYDPDVNEKQITLLPNRTFEFDYVFNVDSTQSMVYECVKPLLDKFLEGFNSTVFAYGQVSFYFFIVIIIFNFFLIIIIMFIKIK